MCLTPGGAECPDIPDPDVLDEPSKINKLVTVTRVVDEFHGSPLSQEYNSVKFKFSPSIF